MAPRGSPTFSLGRRGLLPRGHLGHQPRQRWGSSRRDAGVRQRRCELLRSVVYKLKHETVGQGLRPKAQPQATRK